MNTNPLPIMIKNFISLIFILCVTSITAQDKIRGNKTVTTIETEVNSFNKIVVGEKFVISFKKDDTPSVQIKTDENLHEVIKFSVVDSVLKFKTTKRITSRKELEIIVKYNNALKEIELKDNAELNSVNTIDNIGILLRIKDNAKANLNIRNYSFKLINDNNSRLKLSSKSRLNIDSKLIKLELNESSRTEALINCDSLELNMYQKALAKIEGDATYLKANTINSTNFTGKNLSVMNCDVTTEDSSEFEIQVTDDITIEASGNSEIYLYGSAAITLTKFEDTAKLQKKSDR